MLHTVYRTSLWLFNAGSQKDGLFRVAFSFLIAMLGISLWLVWTLRKSRKPVAPLPPGPRGLPIVGYLPFLGTDNLHLAFTDLAQVYGPIYKLWLGSKLSVVISSPSLAKEVVRDQDITFSERDPPATAKIISLGCNDIVFDSYGSLDWRMKRKVLVREMLSHASIKACHGLRREQVMKTIADVYKKAGKPIDFGDLAFLTSRNAVMSLLGGAKQVGDQQGAKVWSEFRELMTQVMVFVGKPNVSDIFPMLAPFDIQGLEREMKKIFNLLNELLDSMIEARMNVANEMAKDEGKTEQKDFLQLLLELKEKKDTATSITMNQLKALLMDIVVGGTDTTSTMIEWTMAELMQHPEALDKIRKEIDEVVGPNSTVEEAHLPNMRYLDAAVKETFRLHPPNPLLMPRCPRDLTTVGGYAVPKGTKVYLNVWCIQRDPTLWDNPSEFRPERFLNNPDKFDYLGNDFRYMPFGSGRRMCPGVSLGEKMLYSTLASLLHAYDWKLPQAADRDMRGRFGAIMKKMTPIIVIPTPRLSNLQNYLK